MVKTPEENVPLTFQMSKVWKKVKCSQLFYCILHKKLIKTLFTLILLNCAISP